jgi:hypothetical protein
MAQRKSAKSCTQRTPAGLPNGMPGIGDDIEGAIQQAPHPARQSIAQHNRPITPKRAAYFFISADCSKTRFYRAGMKRRPF